MLFRFYGIPKTRNFSAVSLGILSPYGSLMANNGSLMMICFGLLAFSSLSSWLSSISFHDNSPLLSPLKTSMIP